MVPKTIVLPSHSQGIIFENRLNHIRRLLVKDRAQQESVRYILETEPKKRGAASVDIQIETRTLSYGI